MTQKEISSFQLQYLTEKREKEVCISGMNIYVSKTIEIVTDPETSDAKVSSDQTPKVLWSIDASDLARVEVLLNGESVYFTTEALNIATKAKGIALKHQWADNEFTDGWYEEFTIAQAHHELEQNKVLKTETISTLRQISQQDNIIFKSEALKLLALCHPTNNSILQEYFLLQDSIWNERLEVHSRHAQTIWLSKEQEYLNDLKYSQTYIIIACFTIVLLLSGFLYITFSKRLKYNKLKHKKLLNQKANAINNLKDKINYLKHRNIEIQAQITQTSIELRNVQFHEMKIGRFIPTKSNHNKLNQENYKSLLTNRENITSFLKEISLCFPKLYNKLHIEKATTELELIKATYICLFCLDVRTSDIALMMCVQNNSVSSLKKNALQENFYSNGLPQRNELKNSTSISIKLHRKSNRNSEIIIFIVAYLKGKELLNYILIQN